jgi:hypothetical protein
MAGFCRVPHKIEVIKGRRKKAGPPYRKPLRSEGLFWFYGED